MTCKAWLEGSCNCEQPCESDSNSAPEILAPVIINQRQMDEIKTQFKALAEVYDRGYATHIVWKHFNLVAKLLSVDIGGGRREHHAITGWRDAMNARIEKKLSASLFEIAPHLFAGAWKCEEPSEMAENENSQICGCLHIGGGLDYWGEANESYSLWEYFCQSWPWLGGFKPHPEGDEFAYYPNTDGFKPTTINLIGLARRIALDHQSKTRSAPEFL